MGGFPRGGFPDGSLDGMASLSVSENFARGNLEMRKEGEG